MEDQWYWQTKGEEYGPLSNDEIHKLISSNKILPHDRLKYAKTNEWLTGEQVILIVTSTQDQKQKNSASQFASDTISSMHRRQIELLSHEIKEEKKFSDYLQSVSQIIDPVHNVVAGLMTKLADGIFSLQGKLCILGSCLLIIVIILLGNLNLGSVSASTIYNDLYTIYSEYKSIAVSNPRQEDIDQFVKAKTEILEKIKAELESVISKENNDYGFLFNSAILDLQAKRSLYQIAKYDLPGMVRDKVPDREQLNLKITVIEAKFNNANQFITMNSNLAWYNIFNIPALSKGIGLPASWDPATMLIILVDIIIGIWALYAFRNNLMFWSAKSASPKKE